MKLDYGLFTSIELGEWDVLTLERPMSAFLLSCVEMSDDGDMIHIDHLRAAFIGWFCELMGPIYDEFKMRKLIEEMNTTKFSRLVRNTIEGKRSGFIQNEWLKRMKENKVIAIPKISRISRLHYTFLTNARPSIGGFLPPDLERIAMEKFYPAAHQSRIRLYEASGSLPRFTIEDWRKSIQLFLKKSEREMAKSVIKRSKRSQSYLTRRLVNEKICR